MSALWWLRRDIRLADNPALLAALETGPVLPVFILDPHLLARTPKRRQDFLLEGLAKLDADLRSRASQLVIRSGPPLAALQKLLAETDAQGIYTEADFTPYARKRDAAIAASLPLKLFNGQTVHAPETIHKPDGGIYTVFTPYSKTWKTHLPENLKPLPAPGNFPPVEFPASEPLPAYHSCALFPSGEAEALRRLDTFVKEKIHTYGEQRNRMDLDGTSALSPYMRFGMLSLRQAASAALHAMRQACTPEAQKSAEIFLNELIWREFYIGILYHFPRVATTSFNPALANIPWRNNMGDFEAWKAGQTGLPIVDAAMRQLAATGWMHNRARMIVASFLVKDLLINWQWGEHWFMQNLLDGDPAANNGGWQWTAGTGTDAAPYFRIFNPVLQSIKFDPHGDYIRKWVPELAAIQGEVIHAPWEKGLRVPGYPAKPIVDRETVKERTLKAYQVSKEHLNLTEYT